MLYWAYGSNLDVSQMARRCPAATKICPLVVPNARLVFRGVADVEYRRGASCPGGLWEITEKCEKALDAYEGVSSKLYEKRYLTLRLPDGKVEDALFYLMCHGGIMPPDQAYLNSIALGYADFGLSLTALDEAVQRSEKDPLPARKKRR